MGRVNIVELSVEQHKELSDGFREGKSHCFRMRCRCILLKSEGRTSKDVASATDMCEMSVNNWLARYKQDGIVGLRTKSGRGRKPVISESEDKEAILADIKANRQRMRTAKAQWEAESGKKVCVNTFKTFLKSLADGINV